MRRAILLAVVLCCFVASKAEADHFYTGNKLYEWCHELDWKPTALNVQATSYCEGYVMGAVDALNGRGFCISPGAVSRQVVEIVAQYLSQHPENRHYGATVLVSQALKEKFPCN